MVKNNKVLTIGLMMLSSQMVAAKTVSPSTKLNSEDITASKDSSKGYFSEQNLDNVVVIAKSKARKLQEQAYAVSVVDLSKQYTTIKPLDKVLNTVSSIRVREDGGVGSNYTFSMNGFSGNQVKFFLDGIPMDNFGSSFNLANLSANIAEHIEVFKGVLPVYLGGDALGGAVNIVTRKNANYLDATYSIGSFGTHKVSLNGAYTNTNTGFTIRTNAFYNYSKNNFKVYAPIVDLNTGEAITVYLFVGTLPYSQYTYVEPCLDMKMDTFLRCHNRMYSFFKGVPRRTVCDNC